jgi:hypothetical protein
MEYNLLTPIPTDQARELSAHATRLQNDQLQRISAHLLTIASMPREVAPLDGHLLGTLAMIALRSADSALSSTVRELLVLIHTPSASFQHLLDSHGGYRPTFETWHTDLLYLADEYDAAQKARGDDRRAHRSFP